MFIIQWNPVNVDTKGTCTSVCINIADTCFIDTKTKAYNLKATSFDGAAGKDHHLLYFEVWWVLFEYSSKF